MLHVDIFNTTDAETDEDTLADLARRIWEQEGGKQGRINLVLTDDTGIVALNEKYLNRDYITDVIAFPIEETEDDFEGEVYVDLLQVERNAKTLAVSPGEELRRVVAHGILHFLGYSDLAPAQKGEMTKRENLYLSQ